MAERREKSPAASSSMAEREDILRNLRLKVAAMTAVRNKWYDLATEATKKLKAAEVYAALQLTLREAVREK